MTAEKRRAVRDRVLKHLVGNKVGQVITVMITHCNEQFSKDVADMIKEEVRTVLSSKLQLLLDAMLNNNER